jgi:hypothetical protein
MITHIGDLILFEVIQIDRGDVDWPYKVTLEQTAKNNLFAKIEGSAYDPGNSETEFIKANPNLEEIYTATVQLVAKYHLEEAITSSIYYRRPDEFSWELSAYFEQLEFNLYGLSQVEFDAIETLLFAENEVYKRMADFFQNPDSPENEGIFRQWEASYDPQEFVPKLDLESLLFPNNGSFNLDDYL